MDKNTATVLVTLVAAIAGGAEMRFAVARLESKVESLVRDVTELQRELGPRLVRHTEDE